MIAQVQNVLACDIEALTQTPPGVLEMAFVIQKVGSPEPLDTKYLFFGLDGPRCERTRREFWDNVEMGSDGKTPWQRLTERIAADKPKKFTLEEAALELMRWAREWFKRLDGNLMVITDTPGFDYQFISHVLAHLKALPQELQSSGSPPYSLNYLFGKYQPVCDINSFYKGMGGVLCKWGARDRMIAQLDVQRPRWLVDVEEAYDHNPLNDAKAIAGRAAFYLSLAAPDESANKKAKTKA